eukprot:7676573-Pyramimonas_sp.AAC.1
MSYGDGHGSHGCLRSLVTLFCLRSSACRSRVEDPPKRRAAYMTLLRFTGPPAPITARVHALNTLMRYVHVISLR